MARRRWMIPLGAAVALMVAVAGCSGSGSQNASEEEAPTTLRLAPRVDNNSFDPANLDISHNVQYWQPIYDTLLKQNPDTSLSPNLALSWEYDGDGTELTLKLRQDITFTDGTPFNADAVVANFDHFKAGTGKWRFTVDSVDSVEALADDTVVYHLSEPNPALLTYLSVAAGAIASPQALASGDIESDPVGSGPYVLDESTERGVRYVYERNPDYWNAEDYPFDELVLTPMTDATPRLNALKTGQVDGALVTTNSKAEAESSGLNVVTYQTDWIGLSITDRDGEIVPALGDVRVRQALNMAIDKAAVLKAVFQGLGKTTSQIFNEGSAAYLPELDDYYTYDPDQAKALLAEAGYPDGFSVTMPSTTPYPSIDPIVDQQLADVGVEVIREGIPADQFNPATLSGDYALFSNTQGSRTAWDDILKYVLPTGASNPRGSESPELTALVRDAQYAGEAESEAAFQKVNTWLVENAWTSPWMRIEAVYATSGSVEVTPQTGNAVPFIRNYAPAE